MTDDSERWLPVPGYEGYYEVSDRGRVRSITRVVQTSAGPRTYQGRIRRQSTTGPACYPGVSLSRVGVHKTLPVHVLVLTAFKGPCPPGQEARHGPAGNQDSSITNLCWGTRVENAADRLRDGTHGRGERSATAKLTGAQVDEIRARYAAGSVLQRELAAEFNITRGHVSQIIIKKRWHYPDD